MREAPGKYLYFAQKSAGQLGCIAHLGTGCANFGGRRQGGAAGPRPGTLAGLGTFSLPKQKSLSKLSPRTPRGDRAEMALARLALASLALAALAGNAAAATNFTQLDPLPALSGCTPSAAGTAPPALDAARTNMTRDAVAVAAWSLPVDGRKIELRLGKETSGRAECVAAAAGNEASCRHELALAGTWRSLRACGWTGPDTASKPGFEVRNNTIYLEWEDQFPTGKRSSRLAYPVSIQLPLAVQLQASTKLLEESGIKNFNLTGVSFDQDGLQRFLVLDFQMYSRWPNNLTLNTNNLVDVPGYPGQATLASYQKPTCVKTDGSSGAFTTDDFCWQYGQVRIFIGDVCQVGGKYKFNFDTDCFPGAADTQDCKGKVLSANALVGDPADDQTLVLNLCNSLFHTAASVTAQMVSDKPGTPVDPWVQCATYGATCTFPGTRRVRYGNSVIGAYLYLTRTGSAVCSQDGLALGANDPAYGYDKQCWIEADVQDAAGSPYTTKDTTVGNVAGGAPGTDLGPAFGLDSVEVLAATIGGSWLLNSGPAKVVRWPAGSNAGAAAYVLARFDLPLVKMVSLNVEVVGGVARAYQTGARYANAPAGVFSADSMSDAATIATFEGAGGIAAYGQYLCTSLTARVSTAPRRLRARQAAGGYFFGDTVKLTATFVSPDLPIFESRLIKLSVGRNVVLRSPAQASAPGFLKRFIKTDLVDSPAGPGAPGALSQLAVNTNFSYTPGADEVVMHITPNMLPRDDPGKDYASLSFLTTDDFDSVTDYTFYATFRIYFDVVTANGGRRRRLYTRDASFPSKGVRQTTSADADARAGMVVPPDPSVAGPTQNPASAPAATATAGGSTDVLAVLAVAVCAAAMVASCCAMGAALLTFRRRERDAGQRAGKDGYGPLKDEMLGSSKMPAWGV